MCNAQYGMPFVTWWYPVCTFSLAKQWYLMHTDWFKNCHCFHTMTVMHHFSIIQKSTVILLDGKFFTRFPVPDLSWQCWCSVGNLQWNLCPVLTHDTQASIFRTASCLGAVFPWNCKNLWVYCIDPLVYCIFIPNHKAFWTSNEWHNISK